MFKPLFRSKLKDIKDKSTGQLDSLRGVTLLALFLVY